MTVVTPRRLAAAVAIPALAFGLTACGAGSESSEDTPTPPSELSPEQVILSSYEGLAGESYRMEMTMTVNGIDFLSGTSLVEGEASQVSQDMYMSALLEASGEDFSEDPEAAEMLESLFTDIHSEMIVIDDVVYVQFIGGMLDTSEAFGEDAWFTTDLSEFGDLEQIYEQFGSFDLASQTERLLTEITDVQESGDGVYTGTLSGESEMLSAVLGAAGDPTAEALIDGAEVSVTVDDQGLLSKVEITFPELEGMTMHLVSEVVEIGGSYGITAPESDNLYPFEELINAAG